MSNPVKALKGKNVKKVYTNYRKNVKKVYTNYRLKTRALPIFYSYHEMFYKWTLDKKKYIKKIPENIVDLIDPIVLSYLIQGDGNYDKGRKRVRIYTNSYTKSEVENLALAINIKLKIYTAVLHDRKDQWILTIGANNLDLLRSIVSPYFHQSMLYRIGL